MKGSSAELRLPTVAVPVEFVLGAGPARRGEVYVGDAARHGRADLVVDVLATLSGAAFVPMRIDGQVHLVGVAALAWVRLDDAAAAAPADAASDAVPAPVERPEPSEVLTLFDHKQDVEIELVGGAVVGGSILYTSPADRQRAADHLNDGPRFLRLWSARGPYLINKQHIALVREVAR
ncbi:MAG: hypothetical protein KBG28_29950 [Kofleriaceae bacterium]|jgi:hypothetical protein|nr:hypothetical protein [Kofleriaceae bacterium]MBP6838258.1 hypothetical protein [Kofleriaceae bacterium]MBP9208230.1 hypothetical protein [Kofleriaceae bacterium]